MGRPKGSKNGIRKTIYRTCEICGVSFQVDPYRVDARFCSVNCKNKGHVKDLFHQELRKCLNCGKEFMARPSDKKQYCCIGCASHYQKTTGIGLKTSAQMVEKVCPVCERTFTSRKTLYAKYCSKDCANKSFERRITLTCQICGKKYVRRAKFNDQKTCSRACRTIAIGKTESYLEKKMANGLEKADIRFEKQFPIWHYTVDFAVPEKKLIIECDGEYWHSLPQSVRRDIRKDKYLSEKGWHVLRFRESEINLQLDKCLQEIKRVLCL